MKFRDMMMTALNNLSRHKARTALTTVGVVVGILTIVTMVSLGVGVQTEMQDTFNSVGLESIRLRPVSEDAGLFDPFGEPKRTKLLTPELVGDLEARDDVVEAIPFLQMPYSIRMNVKLDGQEVQANAWGPQPSNVPDPFVGSPKALSGSDTPPKEGGAIVLGEQVLEELGYVREEYEGLIGEPLDIVLYAPRGDSQAFPVTIAGITDNRFSSVAMSLPDRLSMLQWWFNDPDYMQNRGYDEIFIRAKSLNDATHLVDWLDTLGYSVQSLKTMLDMANRGMVIIQTMLGSVGALALLVASIGIANTMIMAVYERTKEIGILKAVGAAPGQIRWLFVIEASLIGLLGGVIGTISGWLLGKGLNLLLLQILEWQDVQVTGTYFVVTWWLVLGSLAFATLIGLVAGLYPAARAARLAPLDALRYE
jgi:putative ABC transport system permease protein